MARPEVTSGELVLLRTPGQWSRFWLAFFKPNVIYTARLDSVPSSTDRVADITFTSGSGTLANVKKEMTLWVGSTAGARDLGVCRLRKAPISGTFYLGFTAEVNWQASAYLTVVDAFAFAARVPRVDAGTLKLDYEYTYSDQHEDFEPVPVLGPHAVAWLTGADVDVEFDGSDSWVFGSTITGYSWSAPGASATSGLTTATPTLTYDTEGYYCVYCTVTAANGKTYTGVRHVFIFSSSVQPQAVELTESPSGSLNDGGCSFGVKMYADADPTDVLENCLAVLFGEDHFGETQQNLGQVANRENLICMGYVAGESINWDAEISEAQFSIPGAQALLGQIETTPLKLSMATNTPDNWEVLPSMTVDRALWHLLHWRSNVTALMDVILTDDARYLPLAEAEGSLWEQLSDVAEKKIFAIPYVDRFGRLFVKIDPQLTPVADRTWGTVMTLTKQDWKNNIQIRRRTKRELSMLSTSGWICDPSGTVNTVYSLSMGHIDARYGKPDIIDKLLASSQSQFNTLAGLYMGWKNRELDFEISLGQNNRMIDLFPPQYLAITLAAGDTPRGIAYEGNLIPRSFTLEYDAESMCFETILTCEQETFAELAVNGDIPPATGWDADGWDSSTFPDFEMPDLSDLGEIITLPPETENLNHPRTVVVATNKGVFYTTTFHETDPVWVGMNNGLTLSDFTAAYLQMVVTPNGSLWLLVRSASDLLYRASSLGGTWSLVADGADLEGGYITALGMNPNAAEQIAIVAGSGSVDESRVYVGGAGGLSAGSSTFSNRPGTTDSIVYKNGNWYVFGSLGGAFATPWAHKFSISGALLSNGDISTIVGQDNMPRFALPLPTKFFQWDGSGTGGHNTVTTALVATRFTTLEPAHNPQGVAFSPTGNYGMGATSISGNAPYLSTDGGATWTSVAAALSTGSDIWENCKDDNRWIFGGGMVIKLTLDRGSTYVTKTGNLDFVAPVSDILSIRFLS